MTCLAAVPGEPLTVYAGTTRGLFVSHDAGLTWTRVFGNVDVSVIAAPPAGLPHVYAGTGNGRVFVVRSETSWKEVAIPENEALLSLAIDQSGFVYAGTSDGAWRSNDEGTTWTKIDEGLGEPGFRTVRTIAADPTASGRVLAGTPTGIYQTMDGGDRWALVSAGLVILLRFDRAGIAYALTTGSVRSSLDGIHWQPIEGGEELPDNISSLAVDDLGQAIWTSASGTIFTWTVAAGWAGQPLPKDGAIVRDLAPPAPLPGGAALAATSQGVFRQAIDGAWIQSREGPLGRVVLNIADDPNSGVVFVSDGFNVLRTANRGQEWSESRVPGAGSQSLSGTLVVSLAVTRTPGGTAVLAGTNCLNPFRCTYTPELWKSTTEGASWEQAGLVGAIRGLVVSPSDRSVAYLSRPALCFSCASDIQATHDGGESWNRVSYEALIPQTIDPDDPRTVYASGGTLRKSIDGGRTWTETGLANVRLAIMTTAGSRILYAIAATYSSGPTQESLARSLDGGSTWVMLDTLPPTGVTSLEVDPHDGEALFAGTIGAGVYRSGDRGESWQPLNRGMETLFIYDLEFEATGGVLYAATVEGIFSLENRSPRLVSPR